MSLLLSTGARKRLVVLGLDGLPLSLARQLGRFLPNIGRIAAEAVSVQAELPELSPVNWTSFFTGEGPEKHGVFGFSRMNTDTYDLRITDSNDVTCPTIFDRLGENALVSRYINLPGTYPVKPFRGMGISGFVSHEIANAAYPDFLKAKLEENQYKLEADTNKGSENLTFLLTELRKTLNSRLSALELLWPDLAWDLFTLVFTETDRLFHFFMDVVVKETHPMHIECMRFLAEWDHAIGVFLEKFDALPSPKRLIVLADHGFTEIKTEVCLNTWLKREGLLSLEGTPRDEWDASRISSASQAFALDPGRIYIHTAERFSRGRLSPDKAALLAHRMQDELKALTYEGTPVFKAIHARTTLYPGANSDQLPDLVCEPMPGFDLKAKFDRSAIFGLHGRTGTHTVDGAIFMDTHGARPERMRDVGRSILKYFDISMD